MENLPWKPRKGSSGRAPNWRGGNWFVCKREGCGKKFYVSPCRRKNGRGRYCSYRCWSIAMPSKIRSKAMKTRYEKKFQREKQSKRTSNYWRSLSGIRFERRVRILERVAKNFRGVFHYAGVAFRSSWEVAFARWCRKNGVRYRYEAIRFKLSTGKSYLPDFYLPDGGFFVEVKAYWWKGQLEKFLLFLREFSKARVYLLGRSGLESLEVFDA